MNNARRLERLNKALEVMSLPPSELPMRFDQDVWGTYVDVDLDNLDIVPEPRHCNTAGCFAGEISMHPWFRQRGLVGEWNDEGTLSLVARVDRYNPGWTEALQHFFGITWLEAGYLVDATATVLDSAYLNRKFRQCYVAGEPYPPITQYNVRNRLKRLIARYDG